MARLVLARLKDLNARVLEGEILSGRLDDARAYDGVRTRRIFAVVLDYIIVGLLLIPFGILVFLAGLLTFGAAWSLFTVLTPIVALTYVWNTLGGPRQSTLGMRAMGVRLDRIDGRPLDGLTAVVHTVLFWAANILLTPLVLVVSLFADRKRTLHDLLLGTVVTRDDV